MDREQAVKYLQSSGFSEEQIKAIEGAFTCDKCVYSTNEGCQYDDITETIPPFEDCVSKVHSRGGQSMNCEDCDYSELSDWDQDKTTGKAIPVYWCERYRKECSSISECQYETESEE